MRTGGAYHCSPVGANPLAQEGAVTHGNQQGTRTHAGLLPAPEGPRPRTFHRPTHAWCWLRCRKGAAEPRTERGSLSRWGWGRSSTEPEKGKRACGYSLPRPAAWLAGRTLKQPLTVGFAGVQPCPWALPAEGPEETLGVGPRSVRGGVDRAWLHTSNGQRLWAVGSLGNQLAL